MTGAGKIHHRARAAQLRDFSGLRIGAAWPSDLDCVIEVDGAAFLIVEYKIEGVDVPRGQRLLIARYVDTLAAGGAAALGIIAEHNQHDCRRDIDCGAAIVRRIRWRGEWRGMDTRVMVRDALHGFFRRHAPQGYRRLVSGARNAHNGARNAHNGAQAHNGGEGDIEHGSETQTPTGAQTGADGAPQPKG